VRNGGFVKRGGGSGYVLGRRWRKRLAEPGQPKSLTIRKRLRQKFGRKGTRRGGGEGLGKLNSRLKKKRSETGERRKWRGTKKTLNSFHG